jgi:iron complex outermembrane receptor protein/outer membrane receptor for ferrienterochelin and colicins
VISYVINDHWKIGLEGSLIGKQYLDIGSPTRPYFLMSSSIHYTIKKVTLVLNGENLLNVRQTHWGPDVFAPFTRPRFAEIWAPVDGVVINFSILIKI